jgi:hypothetical protein
MTQQKTPKNSQVRNRVGDRSSKISDVIGPMPYRLALAGGWIDQPFVSKLNPSPPGSMVVVALKPTFYFMNRCGMGTSTRNVAAKLWGDQIPAEDPAQLVRQLYREENRGYRDPSGSQDMVGLVYPGVSQIDFDFDFEGGLFPIHVESNIDPAIASWLEEVIHILPIAPRPSGYYPLGVKNLDPDWIQRLGQSGKDCFDAIVATDVEALGASMNECMLSWEAILPHTVKHSTIKHDLLSILNYYQTRYAGAMYSGCGGGYLFVASEEKVPGSIQVQVRTSNSKGR